MKTLVHVIGLVVLSWTPLAAQDTPLVARSGSGRPLVQPEGTYVFQHLPHSDIIFEGRSPRAPSSSTRSAERRETCCWK